MPTEQETIAKLERKRENARDRFRKFYENNKEKVLTKQKQARERFNEDIRNLNISIPRHIPQQQHAQQKPRPIRPEPVEKSKHEFEPEPETSRFRGTHVINKKLKEVIPVLNLEQIKENVVNLKGRTNEPLSEASKKRYVDDSKILFGILKVDKLNSVLMKPDKIIEKIEKAEKQEGGAYSVNTKKVLYH